MDYLRDQHYDNDARTDEHTFQLDYTNPITKQHQIDAGGRPAASRDGAECHLCFNVGGSNHSAGPEAICRYPVPVCAAGSGTVDC